MQNGQPPPDQVAAAIAATEHAPEEEKPEIHKRLAVTLEQSTGRHIVLQYPVDLTDVERQEFLTWALSPNPGCWRDIIATDAQQQGKGRIIIPPPGTSVGRA